jgi:hypothetical protein
MLNRTLLWSSALWFGLAGCVTATNSDDGSGEPEEIAFPSFEELLGGKSDTGYIGTQAAELESMFTSRVRVALPDKNEAELREIATQLRENGRDWSHRDITVQVTEQVKYARNALKDQKLDLNLEGGSPTFTQIDVQEGALVLHYELTVESLVKFKELEEGTSPADLVGRIVQPILPLEPKGLFERVGARCTRDDETGGPVSTEDLGAHNLFYYFDTTQDGCPLTEADLVTGRNEIKSSLDAPTVYPEYDQLVADGRIDMAVIFGQITHGELKDNDWGFISFDSFTRGFRREGFRVAERYPDNHGHRLERTYPGGLVVSIKMYTPVQFADEVPREQANEVFRTAIRGSEAVYYNGHAFYGSLKVLDDPAAYPENVYQIVFMDACWSYAYYTKQIFRNRATEADPDGYRLVDVVNNTEPGITGSERTAQILYLNIFKGAAAVHVGGDASLYSWNNLIKYMNDHAEERASYRTKYPDPEIYGASGVRDNTWKPGGNRVDPTPGDGVRFDSNRPVEIPDNDPSGTTSVIGVERADGTVSGLTVEAHIAHTFIGDLVVTLIHGERELVLHHSTGGSTDGLDIRLTTDHFDGTPKKGDWVLRVADQVSIDTGKVTSWAVEL